MSGLAQEAVDLATSGQWIPGFISGCVAILVVIVSGILQARRERHADVRKSSAPGAPTVQEIWQRQDEMERAFRSALVLLREVAEQWNENHPPVLSRKHVEILAKGGYLPAEWEFMVDDRDS